MRSSPFDHRPDRDLGNALRETLSGHDDSAFVRRVMARVTEIQNGAAVGSDWWEVLGSWARPGLAAVAIGLMLVVTMWIALIDTNPEANAALSDPLLQDDGQVIPAAFLAAQPPSLDQLLAEVGR